jgi:hypothetical protein
MQVVGLMVLVPGEIDALFHRKVHATAGIGVRF